MGIYNLLIVCIIIVCISSTYWLQILFNKRTYLLTSLTVSSQVLYSAACLISQSWQIRSDLGCNPTRPPLASNSVSYPVQAQLNHKQLPGWPCNGVLDRALPLREWHPRKAQPSVILPGSVPGPSISEGTLRSQRFLCLRTTAVESASCQHPTFPHWTSTPQKQTWNSLHARSPRYATEDLCHQCDLYYYF